MSNLIHLLYPFNSATTSMLTYRSRVRVCAVTQDSHSGTRTKGFHKKKFLSPSLAIEAPGTLLGCGCTVTRHPPDDAFQFLDPAPVAIGVDERASVTILVQTYAEYDEVGLRATGLAGRTTRRDLEPASNLVQTYQMFSQW